MLFEARVLWAAALLSGFSASEAGGCGVAGEGSPIFLGTAAPRGYNLIKRCILAAATRGGVRDRVRGLGHEALKRHHKDRNTWGTNKVGTHTVPPLWCSVVGLFLGPVASSVGKNGNQGSGGL